MDELKPIELDEAVVERVALAIKKSQNGKHAILADDRLWREFELNAARAAIAAWNARAPAVPEGWRDIATDPPPKDGKFVLIWDGEVRALASWQRDRWFGVDELGLRYDSRTYTQPGPQPTHWQYLPAAPKVTP